MTYLLARLREQGTHTGVALFSAIILLAQIAGIDLRNLADSALGIATALGALAGLGVGKEPAQGVAEDGRQRRQQGCDHG